MCRVVKRRPVPLCSALLVLLQEALASSVSSTFSDYVMKVTRSL